MDNLDLKRYNGKSFSSVHISDGTQFGWTVIQGITLYFTSHGLCAKFNPINSLLT